MEGTRLSKNTPKPHPVEVPQEAVEADLATSEPVEVVADTPKPVKAVKSVPSTIRAEAGDSYLTIAIRWNLNARDLINLNNSKPVREGARIQLSKES